MVVYFDSWAHGLPAGSYKIWELCTYMEDLLYIIIILYKKHMRITVTKSLLSSQVKIF